tara:strand:- start:2007 stop:3938 length:1932 start_codon:yes stop_codon:yes gene_type:complete
MATYVNYAERNAADQVDWSAIGTSISKTLLDERDRRENAKKEIADASNKYAETLANAPIGESKDFNQFTLDFADNAQEFRLMQDRMLRDGRMKLRDYNVARQNLTTGTKEAFNLANEYNAEYAKKMERFQNQKSQSLESFLMGTVEGFGNFNESSLYIDPNTGKVVAAKKEKKTSPDGTIIYEMSANPNDFSSIANLKNRIKSEYNKFNVSENLQSGVDDLGKRLEVIMQGGVKTREDAKQTPGFKEARDTYIDSFVNTNPDNVTSILTDYITQVVKDGKGTGQEFEFTFDKEQAASDEKYILLRESPQTGRVEGDFTTSNGKKQKEMAREALKSKFNTMIDVVETAIPTAPPSRPTATERTAQKEGEIGYGLALALTSGGAAAGESLQKIKANNNSIGNVYETDTSYVIQYNDGASDKTIEKIMRDGVEAREESAVSLMAAVNPNYDATKAETAKQRYLKSNKIGERTEEGLFGERTAIAAENSSTYQTKSEKSKKDKGISIAEQIQAITPDATELSAVNNIIKDIIPLPGTEDIINKIKVTSSDNYIEKDDLFIEVPEVLLPFVKDVSGVYNVDGNKVQIIYDDDQDNATLTNVIDGIIAGMYDIYNKSDARNRTEDTSSVTATTTGTTAQGNLDVFGNPK